MADLALPPLLSHAPELHPPRIRRWWFLPAALALLGMLLALACATTGQDNRRSREELQLSQGRLYWQNELRLAQEKHASQDELDKLQAILADWNSRGIPSYAKYGRQFTSWDGYRYEEIVREGYLYHLPTDTPEDKDSSVLKRPGWPERRLKNVVWYPLYPVLGWITSQVTQLPAHHALTAVSWSSTLLASVVTFLLVRRHFFNRANRLGLAGIAPPTGDWQLQPYDWAAFLTVVVMLFGPCSIFLYANFTEAVFTLLLATFLYCLQSRWWWRAAVVAAIASSCRSQGVLFGPILALTYFLRSDQPNPFKKIPFAALLGFISGLGLLAYAIYLQQKFGDAFAFMHAQKYWNVGINLERLMYAANPMHALTRFFTLAMPASGGVDWPRLWEAACLIWPPILLLLLGGRYLSFELEIFGWILWGLPYVSNSLAGNPPMDTQWMSMGRFIAVSLPHAVILGALFARHRSLSPFFFIPWITAFGVFAVKYGNGEWIG